MKQTQSTFQLSVESNSCSLWFCFTSLCDWLEKLAPLSRPIRSKPKPVLTRSHAFSRTWRLLQPVHAFASGPDWFIRWFMFAVISQNNCFGFGFRSLNWKPLHIPNALHSWAAVFQLTVKEIAPCSRHGSNFWVGCWNSKMWSFKWKLLSSTFLWCCLLCSTRWF